MIDGFWTVHFEAGGNRGAGVVVLTNGKIFGGDSGFTYIGSYSLTGDTMTGEVKAQTFEPTMPSLLGVSSYTLNLRGNVSGDIISGQATTPARPGVTLNLRLQKRSAL
jgi:hypothetical protein